MKFLVQWSEGMLKRRSVSAKVQPCLLLWTETLSTNVINILCLKCLTIHTHKKLLVNLCTWSCQRLRPVKQTGYFPLACQLGFVDLLSYKGLQEICLLEINIFVCKLFKPNIFFFQMSSLKQLQPTQLSYIHYAVSIFSGYMLMLSQ